MRSFFFVALFFVPASRGTAQAPQRPAIPADAFAAPGGTYAIGVVDTVWVDRTRPEALTKATDDRRHVPVRIWYPARATDAAVAPYVLRRDEFPKGSPFDAVHHVMTHAVVGAPVAGARERFPVLLYNPGGGWNRFTATFVVEPLVARGYVVVAVDHLGFNQSTHLADGYDFTGDTLGFPTPTNTDPKADALASWDYLEKVLFPMWVGDAQFVLDRLALVDRDAASPLRGRLDLLKVGAFGWSFGGATAVDLLVRDARVKAAVDQDGQLFGMGRVRGATRPVMLMHNTSDPFAETPKEQWDALREMVAAVDKWNADFTARSTGDVIDVKVARTTHGHFSDLTLFFPRDTTKLAPARAHEVIGSYTLAFFDQYLRGQRSPLLSPGAATPAEVTVTTKPGR